jgi:hypothetical protein
VPDFWKEAIRDLSLDDLVPLDFERYNLINRACQITQGLVADVVSEAYMEDTNPVLDSTGKYYVSGASWTVATKTLTATMDSDWASTNVGNIVIFRDGTDTYIGTISAWTDATNVVLRGDALPAADITTVDDVMMVNSAVSYASLDISTLPMLRYGTQVRLQIMSTETDFINSLPSEQFERWRTTAQQNLDRVVWTLVGQIVYFQKGTSITTLGTLTFRYPRVAKTVTSETDYIDLLDGSMMQVGIMVLRSLIQKRLGIKVDVDKNEIAEQIQAIYRQSGGEIKKEEITKKVEALV